MAGLDWRLFHWLNAQAGQHGWLDELAKIAATRLAVVIVVTLVGGWLLSAGKRAWRNRELPRGLITVVVATGLTLALVLVINQVIGRAWFRPRPYASHARAHLIVSPSHDPSFPSDHATAGFALSLAALKELPRTAALVFIETLLLSAGRVFVGLHYPGDILGGLAVAVPAALLVTWVVDKGHNITARGVAFANGVAEHRGWPLRLS